jgi:hypothetical protein
MRFTTRFLATTMMVGSLLPVTLALAGSGGGDLNPALPHIQLHLELSPTGSFLAESQQLTLKGVTRKGTGAVIQEIVLPLDSLATGISLRDEHMKKKYFETQKHPIAVLRNVVAVDGSFKAKLLIRGVEKEVEGDYEAKGAGVSAKFKTNLSDFKIPEAKYMGVGVEDEVEVEVVLPKL